MKFIKGVIIGTAISAGMFMMYNETSNKKKTIEFRLFDEKRKAIFKRIWNLILILYK